MTFKNFPEFHNHVQSLDSASSPKSMCEREVELGTGYITVTDHGTLEATRPIYDMCAKGGEFHGKLTPILGLESYFRDDADSILMAKGIERTPDYDESGKVKGLTFREYVKYQHLTMHCLDEKAFFALTKKLSDADYRAEKHGSERKPLFDWNTIEELGQYNITVGSSCLIGMVSRPILDHGDFETAEKYYQKLRGLVKPGNFLVELFPHATDRNWVDEVLVTYTDGSTERFKPYKNLKTNVGEIKASALANAWGNGKHTTLHEVMEQRKWVPRDMRHLANVQARSGFFTNPCTPWCADGDYQRDINQFVLKLADKYGDPVLVSSDAHFAHQSDKAVQDVRLMQHGGSWRFAESHHRYSSDEAFENFRTKLGATNAQMEGWIENGYTWAARFKDFKFSPRESLPTNFYPKDTLKHTYELIEKHGRMDWNNQEWVDRLEAEIDLLHRNGTIDLLSYFMVFEEVGQLYLDNDQLVGSGRGSAGGLLLLYLLGITHVDPIRYKLSKDRFITADRIASGKLPDVDQDLRSRDLLVDPNDSEKGWLKERFGRHVAQLCVDVKLKLKSSIRDVHRALYGRVDSEVEAIAKSLSDPPQGIESHDHVFGYEDDVGVWQKGQLETDPKLQAYVAKYPKEWEIVQKCLGLARGRSRHPCAFVVSNTPIDEFIPMTSVGGVRVTAFTHAGVEAAGGLKMDFLTVNAIRDVEVALKMIQSRHAPYLREKGGQTLNGRLVPNIRIVPGPDGKLHDIYDLPNDPAVYRDIALGKVETVFQLDAPAARQGLRQFKPIGDKLPICSIEGLAAFTALDRPGPLDAYVTDEHGNQHNMLVEFARRARGEQPIGSMPVLDQMCPTTHGILCMQEQLQAIFQEVGGTTGIEANNFRQRISKKKMVEIVKKDKPLFMKGAIPKLGQSEADRLWGIMEACGSYLFCLSHATTYVINAFACAYLKHYFPLEWWTAVLRNADRNEVDEKFWKYINGFVLLPDIRQSKPSFEIEGDKIRAPLWLVTGIGEKAQAQLAVMGTFDTIEDLLRKIEAYKAARPRPGTKTDKKTGEVIQIVRPGLSPLNDSIIKKLIVCGVLDSLFPTEGEGLPVTTTDRLAMFERTASQVRNQKKYKGTATTFNLTSEARQFQYRKTLMPAYSAKLVPILRQETPSKFRTKVGKETVLYTDSHGDEYVVVNGKQFEYLQNLDVLPPSVVQVALPVYIVAQRKFDYTQKSTGNRVTACELSMDVDGTRLAMVKWPGKAGLPPVFAKDLTGSMGVVTFQRSNPQEPFFMLGYELLVEPLTQDKEESSG